MKIIPLNAALGAQILDLDLSLPIHEDDAAQLRQAYLDHLLLYFKNQTIDDSHLIKVAKIFGELMLPPAQNERSSIQKSLSPPEITVVSNVKINGVPIGQLGDGEVVWHSDYSFKEVIGGMRVLHGILIPPAIYGGITEFANMYAAYDDLSPKMKEYVLSHTIKHDTNYDTNRSLRMGATPVGDPLKGTGPIHPIVSTHPDTKLNTLFLGRRLAHYILNEDITTSDQILDELWAHATQEKFVYKHQWEPGDVVLWDNRCTIHKRGPFDSSQERILHAAQVIGHKPFLDIQSKNLAPHPRASLLTGS